MFVPRGTPPWFAWFAEYAVFAALVVVWGPVVWAAYELHRGRPALAALMFAAWVPLFAMVARLLHRRGLVRLGVSMMTTALFIAVSLLLVGIGR